MSKVFLKIVQESGCVVPKFTQCIINLLEKNAVAVDVEISILNEFLTISKKGPLSSCCFSLQVNSRGSQCTLVEALAHNVKLKVMNVDIYSNNRP